MLMARLRGYGKAAAGRVVDALIDRFDIGEFRDKLVKSVSGGQRRRVDLAASLVVQPQLLVLDEPTTGLDPRSRQVVWSTVRDLVDEGVTLLLTTQYLEEADALADNIVLIDHGRAVAAGTPSELKARIGDQRVDVVAVDGRGPRRPGRRPLGPVRPQRRPGSGGRCRSPPPTRSPTWPRSPRPCAPAGSRSTRSPCGGPPSTTPSWPSPASRPPPTSRRRPDRRRPRGGGVMTTVTAAGRRRPAAPPRSSRPGPGRFARYLRETGLLVGRGLRTIPRVPERLSDVTIQPIMFTLLFLYVFGSAIHIPGMRYQDYLLPGLLGQSVAFGVIGAGVATADRLLQRRGRPVPVASGHPDVGDLRPGDRPDHRADPRHRHRRRHRARPRAGARTSAAAGVVELVALMLLGLFAFTWFGVLMGMLIRSSDAMQGIGFAIMLPLSFLAGTFVPISGMKLVPRAIGEWDPLSALVAAVRQVCQGTPSPGSLQLDHPVPAMVGWCVLIIAVCVPLALRRFRTASA